MPRAAHSGKIWSTGDPVTPITRLTPQWYNVSATRACPLVFVINSLTLTGPSSLPSCWPQRGFLRRSFTPSAGVGRLRLLAIFSNQLRVMGCSDPAEDAIDRPQAKLVLDDETTSS